MTATVTPTQPFLATILDQHYADFKAGRPYDDGPCLVYADFLEEQGDPRAEFIRLQVGFARCRMCHRKDGTPRNDGYSKSCGRCRPKCKSRRREAELLKRHGAEWLDCLPDGIRLDDGRPSASPTVRFVRGFPARFTLTARQAWGEACRDCGQTVAYLHDCPTCHGTGRVGMILPAILAATPVEEVRVSDREPHDSIVRIEGCPWGWGIDDGGWRADSEWHPSLIPTSVYSLIDGREAGRAKYFHSPAAAHAALSRAVIRHGLQGAG